MEKMGRESFSGLAGSLSGGAAHDKFRPDLIEWHADKTAVLFD
jgi:hypothetical protein